MEIKGIFEKIKILGASTRGSLITQMLGLDNKIITSAVDLKINKKGRLIPGNNILIEHDPEHLLPNSYLVMPYQFKKEIISRYHIFLIKGGELIFYRHTFSIIKYNKKINKINEELINLVY